MMMNEGVPALKMRNSQQLEVNRRAVKVTDPREMEELKDLLLDVVKRGMKDLLLDASAQIEMKDPMAGIVTMTGKGVAVTRGGMGEEIEAMKEIVLVGEEATVVGEGIVAMRTEKEKKDLRSPFPPRHPGPPMLGIFRTTLEKMMLINFFMTKIAR